MASRTPVLWLAVICAMIWIGSGGCGSSSGGGEPERRQFPVCAEDRLENTVPAAPWATERSGIQTYRYEANVAGGSAAVELLDERRDILGRLSVRQVFGADDVAEGSIEGILETKDAAELQLHTRGEKISNRGYTVRAELRESGDGPAVEMTARFATVQCWAPRDPKTGPACAADLSIDRNPITLPTCGLIADDRIARRQPPALQRLTYRVPAEAVDGTPSVGAARRVGEELFYQIDVRDISGDRPPATIRQWLRETGLSSLIGSERERLLSTAFLDRSWWRTVERHVAHCDLQRLPRPPVSNGDGSDSQAADARASELRETRLTLCPGDHDSDSWGSGDDSAGGKVWGDPHLVTFDGHAYDLQAAGEFVLFRSVGEDSLEVQGRFEPLQNPAVPECGDLTWNTAAATVVSGHRVSARLRPEWQIQIDGNVVDEPADVPPMDEGASVTVGPGSLEVAWPDGSELQLKAGGRPDREVLNVQARLSPSRLGAVRGLFGRFDGDPSNDYVLPDGRVLDQPLTFADRYDVLASAWRVDETNTLFDYADGASPETFRIPDFPNAPVELEALPEELVAEADRTCRDEGVSDPHLLRTCILDVVCMEDDEQAREPGATEPPLSAQPPGRDDLVVRGAVREIAAPDELFADTEEPTASCRPAEPSMPLFREGTTQTLEADLDIDLADPGAYGVGFTAAPDAIASGTPVDSYHVSRDDVPFPDHSYGGTVRFARPIVGVQVESEVVSAADATLGAADTAYAAEGVRGLQSADDRIAIGPDRRTLEVVWRGDGRRRLRVLTEAPTP